MSADQRRADRRMRLLAATRELLESGGLAQITVTAVCRQAQLSERYFYESFPDRDKLLEGVYDAFADEYISAVLTKVALATDLTSRLRAALSVAPELDAAHPDMHHVLGHEADDGEAARARAHVGRKILDLYLANHSILFQDQAVDPLDAELALRIIVAGGLDLTFAYYQGKFDVSADELATRMANLLEPLTRSFSFDGQAKP